MITVMPCCYPTANHESVLDTLYYSHCLKLLELHCVNEVPNKVHTLHLVDTSFKSLLIGRFPHSSTFFLTNFAIYFCLLYRILYFLDFVVVTPPLSFRICVQFFTHPASWQLDLESQPDSGLFITKQALGGMTHFQGHLK